MSTAAARTIEARPGSMAKAAGRRPESAGSQLSMAEWKRVVADTVASDANIPLRLVYFGGANQIAGYRLYYMLQYAKRAGVRHVSLLTDGLFWIDEATEWLVESGVDEILLVVTGGEPGAALAARIGALSSRGAGAPAVRVRATGAGALA
jgi:hypothetical protein